MGRVLLGGYKERASVRTAVAFLVWGYGAGVAWAASGDAFAAHCQQQIQAMGMALPGRVDVATVCRCQAEKLRAKGYDPDGFSDGVAKLLSRGMQDDAGNDPDAKTKREVTNGYVTMMQASGAAFAECLPNKARDSMQKAIADLNEKQARAVKRSGNNGQGAGR